MSNEELEQAIKAMRRMLRRLFRNGLRSSSSVKRWQVLLELFEERGRLREQSSEQSGKAKYIETDGDLALVGERMRMQGRYHVLAVKLDRMLEDQNLAGLKELNTSELAFDFATFRATRGHFVNRPPKEDNLIE